MAGKRCYGCMNIKTSSPVCEHCGYNEYANNEPHQLPCGTVLQGQYLVGKVLGQGGFGITYLGWDQYLNTPVAIKEFYPSGFVNRDSSYSLTVTSYETATNEAFQSTRARFLREAQTLARLSGVEEVVHVRNFFEVNNTAYIIMEYVQGIDLRRYINMRGGRLSAQETLEIMKPIMRALIQVHSVGVIHRDISPDNIMLQPNGSGAKLLDFGAVRNVEVSETDAQLPKSTEAILKHGFAPIEQYQRRGAMGPWTDEYALCATMYYCMTGRIPADAPERMMEEISINWAAIPGLTPDQMAALDKGMAVRAKDRFPSVQELYNALYPAYSGWTTYQNQTQYSQIQYSQIQYAQPEPQPQPVPQPEPEPQPVSQPEPQIKHDPPGKKTGLLIPVAAAALAAVVLFGVLGKGGGEKKEEGTSGISRPGQTTTISQPERQEKKDLTHTFSDGSQQVTVVDDEGFEVERILRDGAGNQIRRYAAVYDDNGDMTRLTTFDENDREVFREEWDYTAPGQDVEYRVYESGTLVSKNSYEYDTHGNVVYNICYDGNGRQTSLTTMEREYDAAGNQLSSTSHYGDGSFTRFVYDSNGMVSRYESYDENGVLTFANDREYDAYGNQVRTTNYTPQGAVEGVWESEFDEYGNELREDYYAGGDQLSFSQTYVLDENGTQVGYTYQSYTYSSTTDYEQMRSIDGSLVRQFWSDGNGYRGESGYDLYGNQRYSASYDGSGRKYAESEYHYNENNTFLGYTGYYHSTYDGTTTITEYDSDYRITQEKTYDSNGKLCGWGDNVYDENGNLVEEMDYRADGTVEYHREAVFDEKGRRTESTYTSYDENGKVSYVSIDRYSDNGSMESGKSMHYRDGVLYSTSEYEYDSGNMVKCKNYDASGKLTDWYVNEYDDQGRNYKTTYYNASGTMDRWLEREFNDRGKEVKTTCYNADGSLSYWSKTIYDENGNYVDTQYSWE